MTAPSDGQIISVCIVIIGLACAIYAWVYRSEKIE